MLVKKRRLRAAKGCPGCSPHIKVTWVLVRNADYLAVF